MTLKYILVDVIRFTFKYIISIISTLKFLQVKCTYFSQMSEKDQSKCYL